MLEVKSLKRTRNIFVEFHADAAYPELLDVLSIERKSKPEMPVRHANLANTPSFA